MRWTVVAGDRREGEAAACLRRMGHDVIEVGRGPAGPAGSDPGAFAGAEVVLGPVLGTNPAGDALYRPAPAGPLPIEAAWLAACAPGALWLLGRCGPWLRTAAAARGLAVHTYAERDEFATLNAVPTAEGAIAHACRRAGTAAWGSSALVVGGGRCGRALVGRLVALGARVACASRDPAERAAVRVLGADAAGIPDLARAARDRDFLFNTVPAPVVTAAVLGALPTRAVVVDLASAPGGTDFDAARALGLRASLLPAVPGRYFPVTAGRLLAEVAASLVGARAVGGDCGGRL